MLFMESKQNDSIKKARLLQQDQLQLVELPNNFHFKGEEVFVKQVGNAIVLIPSENPWESLFNSLDKFSDDFMEIRNQPTQQTREDIFISALK